MGIVSDTTAAMVRVAYVQDRHGRQVSKLKRPSSCIMLDPSVTVSQDANGTVWIIPINQALEKSKTHREACCSNKSKQGA